MHFWQAMPIGARPTKSMLSVASKSTEEGECAERARIYLGVSTLAELQDCLATGKAFVVGPNSRRIEYLYINRLERIVIRHFGGAGGDAHDHVHLCAQRDVLSAFG